MTISEAFEAYRLVCVFKNQSPKTIETYLIACKLLTSFFGDINIDLLTFDNIREWKMWLDRGRSPATVRGYIICLRVVLEYLLKSGETVCDPDTIPVPKRPQKVPTFITKEEVDELIRYAGLPMRGYAKINRIRNQALVSLLYASGIRASELTQLDRDSIRDRSFTIIGKGGKARLCFIDARTENFIEAYLAERADSHAALFVCGSHGGRLTSNTLQLVFRTLSERAGLKVPVHPHVLRHSFATNLLKNNANMRYVQEMLGHSSLQTTQMYTHVVNRDLQEVYEKFHTV